MALYGGNMIDVTAPDGRRLTVPSDFAAQFPDLQPLQTQEQQLAPSPIGPLDLKPTTEVAGPGPGAMQGREAGAAEPAPPPGTVPFSAMAPISAPMAAQAATQESAVGPVTSPSQAPAGPPNEPRPPPPMTNEGLAKLGNAGVYNAQSEAIDKRVSGTRAAAEVDANEATRVGEAMAARDAETDKILQERAKVAAANQAAIEGRLAEYDRKSKEYASIKIDRKSDHPILAAIGIVLGAIGAAMSAKQGTGDGRNYALDIFFKSIDHKVDMQMKQLEVRRGALGLDRDAINLARDVGKERLAEYDQRKMAALDQAKQKIETIKAQTSSDRTKSSADVAIAAIEQERATVLGTAMDREQTRLTAEQDRKDKLRMHKETLGVQYAQLNQAERHWKADFEEKKFEFDVKEKNDLLAAQRAAGGKGGDLYAKALKENEERGLKDPATGKLLLQPAGEKMMAQADASEREAQKFRAQAEQETDPNKRQAMLSRADAEEQAASQVRGEALAQYAVRGRNAEQSARVQMTLGDTQTAVSLIDEINNKRAKFGPQWSVSTNADQAMRTKMGLLELQIKEAFKLGALDKGSEAYLRRIAGGDPTNITTGDITGMLDAAMGNKGSLDALADALEMRARNELSGNMEGADRFQFRRDRSSDETSAIGAAFAKDSGKTPAEIAAGAGRGAVGQAVEGLLNPFGESPTDRRARQANESGDARFPQLTKPQADAVDMQLRAYKQNSKSDSPEAKAVAEKAGATLVGLTENKDRPALTNAMLGVLKSEAPELYQRALEKLPDVDPSSMPPTRAPDSVDARGMSRAQLQSLPQGKTVDTKALFQDGIDTESVKAPVPNRRDIESINRTVMAMQSIGILRETAIAGDLAAKQELAKRAVAGDKDAARAILDVSARRR